jgi:hypothetical protein
MLWNINISYTEREFVRITDYLSQFLILNLKDVKKSNHFIAIGWLFSKLNFQKFFGIEKERLFAFSTGTAVSADGAPR